MTWKEMAVGSHYQTAVAVDRELREGHVDEAAIGIKELIEALARSEKRALKSQLVRLMAHIIKWQTQPDKRSRSWAVSIASARDEIEDIQEETPSLNDAQVQALWDKCFGIAKREAEAESNRQLAIDHLSWEDVFVTSYDLE